MKSLMFCLVCLIYNSYYAFLYFNIPPKYLMFPFTSRMLSRFHQQLMSEKKLRKNNLPTLFFMLEGLQYRDENKPAACTKMSRDDRKIL